MNMNLSQQQEALEWEEQGNLIMDATLLMNKNPQTIVETGGIGVILRMVRSMISRGNFKDGKMICNAFKCFQQILNVHGAMTEFIDDGGVYTMVQMIEIMVESRQDSSIIRDAFDCLKQVLETPTAVTIFIDSECVLSIFNVIDNMLKPGDANFAFLVCHAFDFLYAILDKPGAVKPYMAKKVVDITFDAFEKLLSFYNNPKILYAPAIVLCVLVTEIEYERNYIIHKGGINYLELAENNYNNRPKEKDLVEDALWLLRKAQHNMMH